MIIEALKVQHDRLSGLMSAFKNNNLSHDE
jgi:hypothetical protein